MKTKPTVAAGLFLLAIALSGPQRLAANTTSRPNLVFFYVDDLGWTDVGYMNVLLQRDSYYETPHIDRLAATAMVFTNAYANAPNCAPSRACLMSGQYTPRHGVYTVGDPRRGNHKHRRLEPIANRTELSGSVTTLAEILRSNSYLTAAMGKWHLGDDPTEQGFHINVAGTHWGSPSGGGYHSPLNYPNLKVGEPGVYLTDRLTDEAATFITENRDRPFFLYLSHYAVHTPIQAKQQLTEKYEAKQPTAHHRNARYAAMIESVDQSLGRVLQVLDDLELSQKTIVVFYSDNGGYMGATSNAPLRGAKGMLYEGGIREPLVIRWPGVTTANSVCDEPVIGVDFYPTFLEILGAQPPDDKQQPLDGVSMVKLLRDPEASLDRDLFWHFPAYLQGKGDPGGGPFRTTPAGAIRSGHWKLIEWFESGRLELYRLTDDIGETQDLTMQHPEITERLHQRMKQWRQRIGAPVPTEPNPRYEP